jgi:hypothetical protein
MNILRHFDFIEKITERKSKHTKLIISLIDNEPNIYCHLGYWINNGEVFRFQENISNNFKLLQKAELEIREYFDDCENISISILGLVRSLENNCKVDKSRYWKTVYEHDLAHITKDSMDGSYVRIYLICKKNNKGRVSKRININDNRVALTNLRKKLTDQVVDLVAKNHGIDINRVI